MGYLSSIWAYRHYIVSSVRADFRNRFARSKIAGAWVFLQPIIQVAIYAVILSSVLSAKLPNSSNPYAYAIYLLAGTIAWGLFSEIVGRCINVFVENGNTLKKIVFPRICLPAIVVSTALVNVTILTTATLCFVALAGVWPGWALLNLLPLLALTLLLATGIGIFLGTLNVFMRDVAQVMNIVLQLWFWFTPVVYPATVLPPHLKPLLNLNPMYPVVDGFHRVLVYQQPLDWANLAQPALVAIAGLAVAMLAFRRAAPDMADVL